MFCNGKRSTFLENGKVILSNLKDVNDQMGFGATLLFGSYASDQLSLKFKSVHLNSERIEYGLFHEPKIPKENKNAAKLRLACRIRKPRYAITCHDRGTDNISHELQVPADLDLLNAVFAVEANLVSRTLRFLLNGQQLHDGDLPIPLSRVQLNESVFFVSLFAPGDCFRIVD